MRVLVVCEFSGIVRDAFIARGHTAISCDLLPTERPGPHLQCDVKKVDTSWFDLVIAHPPCTYLTVAAEWAYSDNIEGKKMRPGTLTGSMRRAAREDALRFVEYLWNLPVGRLVLENPVGCINSRIPYMPKPQYIQPYMFGEDACKKTGLWTRGVGRLVPTQRVDGRIVNGVERWSNQTDSGQSRNPPSADRWRDRSRTYQGIANALADQLGGL